MQSTRDDDGDSTWIEQICTMINDDDMTSSEEQVSPARKLLHMGWFPQADREPPDKRGELKQKLQEKLRNYKMDRSGSRTAQSEDTYAYEESHWTRTNDGGWTGLRMAPITVDLITDRCSGGMAFHLLCLSACRASSLATIGPAFFKHDLSSDELLSVFPTGVSRLSPHKAGSATLFLPLNVG